MLGLCTAILALTAGAALAAADRDTQEVSRYVLTEAGLAKYSAASTNLSKLGKSSLTAGCDEESPASIDKVVAKADASPPVKAAIQGGGMTTREYVVFSMSLLQAGIAAWGMEQPGGKLPPDVSKANVDFYKSHKAAIDKLASPKRPSAAIPGTTAIRVTIVTAKNSRPVTFALLALACAWMADVADAGGKIPVISQRTFVAGNAHVIVTGSFKFTADIALNIPASISDGEDTWLQYGASGSEAPNALFKVSPTEIGIIVAQGKPSATAGDTCQGKLDVTAASVKGHYVCKNVASYDPRSGQMGTVDIDISLVATS